MTSMPGTREKRGMGWAGYKGHFTETVSDPADDDPGTGRPAVPNLITDVPTTHAAVPDVVMTGPVHDSLEAAGLLPGEHAVDSGYVSADLLVSARQRGITLLGPLLADASAQARSGGYTAAAFTIDWDHHQATCPQGAVSSSWTPLRQRDGKQAIIVQFATATCRACPARDKCTTATWTGRQLFLRPREIHEAVTAARAGQDTQHWKARYTPAPASRAPCPGHPRHRHPPRPLPRPGQDPPRAPRRRHRHQPHPARRLVRRQAPRPDQHHPPPAPRPGASGINVN